MANGTNFKNGLKSRGIPVEGLSGDGLFSLDEYDVIYVDGTSGVDTQGGKGAWNNAVATIEQAISVSSANDVIIIKPGTYTVATADLPLTPKANQVFMSSIDGPIPSVFITDDGGGSDTDLIDIEVDNVKFVGIEILAGHADVARLVKVSDSVSVDGLTFLNCRFNGVSRATVNGISAIDGTYILTGLLVSNCDFNALTVGIAIGVKGMALSRINDNRFTLSSNAGSDIGITLADTSAAATGYGWEVKRNWFLGPPDAGKDAVAIEVTGTEDTTGLGVIADNRFAYTAVAAVTIDIIGFGTIQNYTGDATGGLLTDVGS